MAGPLIIGAEDVILVKDKNAYASSRPVIEGITLVEQLRGFPTTSVTVIGHVKDGNQLDYFCKSNGVKKPTVAVVDIADLDEDPAVAQWHVIQRLRSRGPVGMVITAYPYVFEHCSMHYQAVVLFGRRGGLERVEEFEPWNSLQGRLVKSRDVRLELEELNEET